MAHETILIVDDSPSLLGLAAALLRREEYLVHIASNAEQALSTLRMLSAGSHLDRSLQLPGVNGLELTRQIRQIAELRRVLIIAMTRAFRSGIEQEALDAGCNGFIAKPFDSLKLGPRIRQYVEFESPSAPTALPATIDNLCGSAPETGILLRTLLEEHNRQVTATAPLQGFLLGELAQKRIGVFGFPDDESDRASAALERVGARPLSFSAHEWPDPRVIGDCDAIMLHVRPESGAATKWLSSAVGSSFPSPLILAGKRGHLQDLDISLQHFGLAIS